jgi:septum formation protein
MQLILGSTSPRRKEIMEFFSYPFVQESPNFDESTVPFLGDPKSYVSTLALEKAHALKLKHPDSIIVCADTEVYLDGKCLGKPKDAQDAFKMLSSLSDRWHSVFTGLAVITPTVTLCEAEETEVECNSLSPQDIHRYLTALHLHDKAGAYAIQESGSLIVKKIVGCYYNVMGLPINTLRKLLLQAGIDLFDYI